MNWLDLLSRKRLGAEHKFDPSLKPQPERSEFDVDIDRIIFSYPFRRLQDKTQVVPLPEHDFVHTRLTHSLEVSSVGRSLGKAAGMHILEKHPELAEAGYTTYEIGSIVAAASLAHDIGNPPFGHSGEQAISQYFKHSEAKLTANELEDLTNFEGNAQGFRILTDPFQQDLKLTYASLGAFIKYPCESKFPNRDTSRKSQKKFGFYQSEKPVFLKVAEETGLIQASATGTAFRRHPLVFLTEAADDICYLIIDLEDAVRMGHIPFAQYVELLEPILHGQLNKTKLAAMPSVNQQAGLLRALAINVLVKECVTVFTAAETDILSGTFDKDLVSCIPSADAAKEISAFSVEKIYRSEKVLELQAAGFEVLPGLVGTFYEALADISQHGKKAAPASKNTVDLFRKNYPYPIPEDPYLMARVVIDFISGMTDRHAVNFYRKIRGISL